MPRNPITLRVCSICQLGFLAEGKQGGRKFCSRTCANWRNAILPSQEYPEAYLIPLSGRGGIIRGYAIVDAADVAYIRQFKWHTDANGYALRSMPGSVTVRMHREILGLDAQDERVTDHINRNKLDNRRCNLRAVMPAENGQNLPVFPSVSKYRGVDWLKRNGKWRARVTEGRRCTYLGLFDTEDDAGRAALEARKRLMPYAVD